MLGQVHLMQNSLKWFKFSNVSKSRFYLEPTACVKLIL